MSGFLFSHIFYTHLSQGKSPQAAYCRFLRALFCARKSDLQGIFARIQDEFIRKRVVAKVESMTNEFPLRNPFVLGTYQFQSLL
jgi:hypothetical protein